jgi:hypothetical protein
MEIKWFRSIFVIATVICSITISSLPSWAFTWDDFFSVMGAIDERRRKQPSPNPSPPPNSGGGNNEPPSQGGFGDSQPNPSTSQQTDGFGNNLPPSQPVPQQPNISTQQPNNQQIACINAIGTNSVERIDRNSTESSISIRGRTLRVASRISLMPGYSHEIICRILRHPTNERVRFGLAIADNSNLTRVLVGVAIAGQNGVKKQGQPLFAGQAKLMTINTSGVESFSILLRPLNGGGYIYPLPVPQLP